MEISESVKYVGAFDKELDLFESQYKVADGISYNSYIIKDEKTVIMDTIDRRKSNEWIQNVQKELNGTEPDYLVILHMEPDHSYNVGVLCEKYPNMKIVGNAKTFSFLSQFFEINSLEERKVIVKEGDILNLGNHSLQFFMAPMVHWPEVMVAYEQTEKILFSADAFGKFGDFNHGEDWVGEARRFYINIVGKYGVQVQALLKKLSAVDLKMICPLHGPALKNNLDFYIKKYDTWSKYEPEEDGILIAYSSIHGNTKEAMLKLEYIMKEQGKNVVSIDLTRADFSEAISLSFKYSKLIIASSTYNMDIFPPMKNFLNRLKGLGYQNRTIAIVENGTWVPNAANCMNEIVSDFKDINIIEPFVTIKSRCNDATIYDLKKLAEKL